MFVFVLFGMKQPNRQRVAVRYKNKICKSMAELARKLNLSVDAIRYRVGSPKFNDYSIA